MRNEWPTVGEKLAGRVDELTDDTQDVIVGLIPDRRADATDVLRSSIRENVATVTFAQPSVLRSEAGT